MSNESKPATWTIHKGRLVLPSGNLMSASCKHRKAGACGGCYARLYQVLSLIEETPERAKALISEVTRVMKAEARR